jgi:hypothetical protein
MNIEEEFKEFLTEWVKKNYGESEADEPSWSIEALAHDLADKFWKVKEQYDLINITDDVKYVAENNGIELTEKQAQAVADKYRFSDAYCAMDEESLLYYIEEYKGDE